MCTHGMNRKFKQIADHRCLSMEWFYVTSVMVTKFALLLLYLRVFAVSTRFKLTVYFVATTVALWAIVLYIVLVRSCLSTS